MTIKLVSQKLDDALQQISLMKRNLDKAIFKCIKARDEYTEAIELAEKLRHELEIELARSMTVPKSKSDADAKLLKEGIQGLK
jgi:hypothetical protein